MIWALDGGLVANLKVSMTASEIGEPLYGPPCFSVWALDGGFVIILKVSITASEIGEPLYGPPFAYAYLEA